MEKSEETIFAEALQIPAGTAREQFLARECAGRKELQAIVSSLLVAYEADEFLEEPAIVVPATQLYQQGPDPYLGVRVGLYKIREHLGEGGMGMVYVAEQNEPVKRKVALKIIKPGMDSREILARFEAERQALALMDHPNVAKVHDAGTTETGQPFFVMELVKGLPITDYCDKYKLPTQDRLKLFVTVCRAVQHAHLKGIIHRDIKPSNIIVTQIDGQPVPKVIDFGVAKATNQRLTERTIYTQYSQIIGTPLYMSPEQAEYSGVDVDTRTDVYSLGVLLYELLCGSTPFDREILEKAGLDEMRRIIREEDPPRPSLRISTLKAQALSTISQSRQIDPGKFSQSLKGELDWIVMQSLEKDRNRRYESASAFAVDVQRYLDDEPVQACPPTTMYRLRKLARRNRVMLTTGLLIFLALIVGTSVATWQAIEADAARRLANERLDLADARLVSEIAARAETDEQRARATENYDRARKAVDQMLTRVADQRLSKTPELAEIRKSCLGDAVAFYTELLKLNPDDAVSYANRGKVFNMLKEYDKVRADYEKAVELEPDNANYHYQLGKFLEHPIDVVFIDFDAAMLHLKAACRLAPTNASYHGTLANLYHVGFSDRDASHAEYMLAAKYSTTPEQRLFYEIGDAQMLGEHRRVIELGRNLTLGPKTSTQTAYHWVARAHRYFGEYEESIAAANQALTAGRIRQADSANTIAYQTYAVRANSYEMLGRYQEALADMNTCLELAPFRSFEYKRRAAIHFKLGAYSSALSDISRSVELHPEDVSAFWWIPFDDVAHCPDESFRQGILNLMEEHLDSEKGSDVRALRGALRVHLGELALAAEDFKLACADPAVTYQTFYYRALCAVKSGDQANYQLAAQEMLTRFAEDDNLGSMWRTAYSCALGPHAVEDYTPAIELAREELARQTGDGRHPEGLGALLMRAGELSEAKQVLELSLEIHDEGTSRMSDACYFLAMTEHHLGHADAARDQLRLANEMAKQESERTQRWEHRLLLDILREEAESLISPGSAADGDRSPPGADSEPMADR